MIRMRFCDSINRVIKPAKSEASALRRDARMMNSGATIASEIPIRCISRCSRSILTPASATNKDVSVYEASSALVRNGPRSRCSTPG